MAPKKPLNILVVCAYYHPAIVYGGPVPAIHGLNKGLVEHGHAVTVYTTDANGTGDLEVPTGSAAMVDEVPVYYFKRWWFGRAAKPFTLFFCPDMGHKLARLKPGDYDLIINHAGLSDPGRMVAKAARRANIPYFYYTQGIFAPWAINYKRLKKKIYLALIEGRILQHSAGIVVCNETEIKSLEKHGITAPVKRIPWGIEPPENLVKPDRRALAELYPQLAGGNPYILFLSRLHPSKGLELLIPAFARVALQFPDWHLVIAGPDERGYKKVLESLIEQVGIRDRVLLPGMVTENGKAALFANADIFTLPSFSEGFSISIAEALGYGRPVIITTSCYVPEVEEGRCGLIVQPDIDALAQALSNLMGDSGLREACSLNTRKLAAEHFTWEAVIRESLAFYSEGMERHAALPRS
jgi:glycosyltransferase involved in cell wall biosynthesis